MPFPSLSCHWHTITQPYISLSEAIQAFGISKRTIERKIASGDIGRDQIRMDGGKRLFLVAELIRVSAKPSNRASGNTLPELFLASSPSVSQVGMQRRELANLDGEKPAWEIPSGRTKNGRPHSVPLAPLSVAIIANRPEVGENGFLFTNTGATPVSGFSKTKERVDGRIARNREQAGLPPMPDWTLHDLRRTMVTMMNERLGIAPHIVEACVNHVSGSAKAGVAGVYNKALYLEDRRRAFEAWADFLQNLIEPGSVAGNVVKLRG